MKEKERRISEGEDGVVGQRAGSCEAWIELAQIDLACVLVDEQIQLKVAAIAFLLQTLPDHKGHLLRFPANGPGESVRENLIAAPAAFIGSEFGKADQLCHQWCHDSTIPGDTGLNRRLPAANALHHFYDGFFDDLFSVFVPIFFMGDKKRG